MKSADVKWREEVRSRFAARQDLGKEGVYEAHFASMKLPRTAVLELLDLIGREYDLPPGLLRPEDSLSKLSIPPIHENWWQWLVFQVRAGDIQLTVIDELKRRSRLSAEDLQSTDIQTLADLARLWCGEQLPRASGLT